MTAHSVTGEGVGFNPCGEIYGGEFASSEPETAAVSSELLRLGADLAAVVSVHSYGSAYLVPWGNTVNYTGEVCERPDDYDDVVWLINSYLLSYCTLRNITAPVTPRSQYNHSSIS